MEEMNYRKQVEKYIKQADNLIKQLFFKLAKLNSDSNGNNQDTAFSLFVSLHSSSESILILLLEQAIFDADILLRTVMEGTIKYCYLMTGTIEERNNKEYIYRECLSEIDKITDHYKAADTIKILKEFSYNNLKPFESLLLDNDLLEDLQLKYPSKIRKQLKNEWSYQSLLRSLAESANEYKAQLGTISTYALTSHFIHYDWTGISMRKSNSDDNRTSILYDLIHSLRILSNALSFYSFRIMEFLRANEWRNTEIARLSIDLLEFVYELDKIQNDFLSKV